MTFTVKYRNTSGIAVSEVFEAESRSDLFQILKTKGISAISVTSGGTKKTQKSVSSVKINGKVTAGVLVALVLLSVGFYFLTSTDNETAAAGAKPVETKKDISEVQTPDLPKVKEPEEKPAAPEIKREPAAWRNPNLTEAQRTAAYEKTLRDTKLQEQPTNRVFRTGVEQMMDWVFSTEIGEMPMPLPRIPDVDYVKLKEILESKNTILDTDSEKAAAAKETVDYAKKIFKEFIEKGGEPDDFLPYYHDELKAAWQTRQAAQNEIMKVLEAEPEIAQEYFDKVNASLDEKGIKRVIIPPRILMRLGVTLNQESIQGSNQAPQGENK